MTNKTPPCGNYGDIDGDGVVSTDDAVYVMRHAIFGDELYPLTPAQKIKADVDGDGEVSEADAQLIADYVEGIIDTFPVCAKPKDKDILWLYIAVAIILLYLLTRG